MMQTIRTLGNRAILSAVALAWSLSIVTIVQYEEPASDHARADESPAEAQELTNERISVSAARERANLMHEIYAATLDVMHERYFREERAIVPARALEDVFAQIDRQTKIQSRWIAVNTPAMSVRHEAKNDFEKRAARELASGKSEIEEVKDGYYHHARAIPLTSGCIACHTGFFKEPPKTPRFAGLVISIPVTEE